MPIPIPKITYTNISKLIIVLKDNSDILIVCNCTDFIADPATNEYSNAIKAISRALAKGVEKKLLQKALTKGTIYPIVKKVAQWFGVRMTKAVFAGFFKKAIKRLTQHHTC